MTDYSLYTLISPDVFKGIIGIDDREDKLARFCLVTSTIRIEQYCKRKLLRKKYFETIEYIGDLVLPLREYPVTDVLAVYTMGKGEILEREFYRLIPDCGTDIDIPFSIELSPAVARMGCMAVKVVYWAGYGKEIIPDDLQAACMELAAWNFNRYRSKRIGTTGNIKGAGKEGEHFEMGMPENVQQILEPYKRKLI